MPIKTIPNQKQSKSQHWKIKKPHIVTEHNQRQTNKNNPNLLPRVLPSQKVANTTPPPPTTTMSSQSPPPPPNPHHPDPNPPKPKQKHRSILKPREKQRKRETEKVRTWWRGRRSKLTEGRRNGRGGEDAMGEGLGSLPSTFIGRRKI